MLKVVIAGLLAVSPASAAALKVRSHTAPEAGFLVSSHAVQSGNEIAIIDAQMLLDQARQFAEEVKRLEGKVTVIFITHPHPDHFLGLSALHEAFPEARLEAAPDTVDAIEQDGPAMLKFYRETFMGGALAKNLATAIPPLTKHEGKTLKVGKEQLEILSFPGAEAKMGHALWDKGNKILISGDLAYNHVHLWLAEQPPAGWIAALEELQKLKPRKVASGHGEPGGAEVLREDLEYLTFFEQAKGASKSAGELASKVKEKFPDWRAPAIVDLTAAKYFPLPPSASIAVDGGTPSPSPALDAGLGRH